MFSAKKLYMKLSPEQLALAKKQMIERDADKEDAERYRWLRDPKNDVALVLDKRTGYVSEDEQIPGVGGYHTYEYRAGVELDAAIDAARKESEK